MSAGELPAGPRRTDHRAYAVKCRTCSAAKWRACVGQGIKHRGDVLAKPHPARVKDELAARTTAKDRTPPLIDVGEDPSGGGDG